MTPEEHISEAEKRLSAITGERSYTYDTKAKAALASIALVHIEMAKWKESHGTTE